MTGADCLESVLMLSAHVYKSASRFLPAKELSGQDALVMLVNKGNSIKKYKVVSKSAHRLYVLFIFFVKISTCSTEKHNPKEYVLLYNIVLLDSVM